MSKPVEDFTVEELTKELITLDFHGKEFKEKCLAELLLREYNRGLEDGRYQESFYSTGSNNNPDF